MVAVGRAARPPSSPSESDGRTGRPGRFSRLRMALGRLPGWVVLLGLALLVLSAALSARATDTDSGYDLLGVLRAITVDAARLRWQYMIVVVALAALHYLATAIAARAAAGTPLRLRETVLVQLAASAANRLTPAGLGGSAVNARYFSRRGLALPSAVGAVVILDLLGSVADILVLGLLAGVGRLLGLGGATAEMSLLASKLYKLTAPLRSSWTLLALAAVVMIAVLLRRHLGARGGEALRRFAEPLRQLRRRPAALFTLLLASGSTTLVLAFAFVASTAMVPGPQPHVAIGGLLVGFMLGSAASNAVPTPAGVGSTETALTLVLVTSGVPAAHAVEVVLIYRLLTFWLPAIVGLFATRHLHRVGAL
jgi:uncharacterized membrane protein YbhN (UPF0104 family)